MKVSRKNNPNKSILRLIPSIQDLLQEPAIENAEIDAIYLKQFLEKEVEVVRTHLLSSGPNQNYSRERIKKDIVKTVLNQVRKFQDFQLRQVINGTGIILHTNLGRAPVADAARQHALRGIPANRSRRSSS